MAREISPGVHWIQECGSDRTSMFIDQEDQPPWYDEEREVHLPQNVFVFDGEESLLFDTLSPASSDHIVEQLREVLGDDDLDYLVVSHPDVPHAGNTRRIMEEYPDVTLVAPEYGTGHELYHLDDAMLVGEGDTIDLGGHVIEFHEATFPDAAVSVWATEQTENMLLPVDWLGFPHSGHECLTCVDELEHDVGLDRLFQFHGRVLFWYQYVDVDKTNRTIDYLIERYDPSYVLPAHGLVIREDANEYMRRVKDAVELIDERGRVGTLG